MEFYDFYIFSRRFGVGIVPDVAIKSTVVRNIWVIFSTPNAYTIFIFMSRCSAEFISAYLAFGYFL